MSSTNSAAAGGPPMDNSNNKDNKKKHPRKRNSEHADVLRNASLQLAEMLQCQQNAWAAVARVVKDINEKKQIRKHHLRTLENAAKRGAEFNNQAVGTADVFYQNVLSLRDNLGNALLNAYRGRACDHRDGVPVAPINFGHLVGRGLYAPEQNAGGGDVFAECDRFEDLLNAQHRRRLRERRREPAGDNADEHERTDDDNKDDDASVDMNMLPASAFFGVAVSDRLREKRLPPYVLNDKWLNAAVVDADGHGDDEELGSTKSVMRALTMGAGNVEGGPPPVTLSSKRDPNEGISPMELSAKNAGVMRRDAEL